MSATAIKVTGWIVSGLAIGGIAAAMTYVLNVIPTPPPPNLTTTKVTTPNVSEIGIVVRETPVFKIVDVETGNICYYAVYNGKSSMSCLASPKKVSQEK